jgi:hypothetical protein
MKTLFLYLVFLCGSLIAAESSNKHKFVWNSDEGLSGTGETYLVKKAFRIARRQIEELERIGKLKVAVHRVTIIWKGKKFIRNIHTNAKQD